MDWSKGFVGSFYMTEVDPVTWQDQRRIEIVSGSITKKNSGLLQSASVECTSYDLNSEKWVRLWLVATQDGEAERTALFTGLANSPSKDIQGNFNKFPVKMESVLRPAKDILLPRGYYAPTGMLAADIISHLLSVTPAPVVVDEHSPMLMRPIIAESRETNLSMVGKILEAINWQLVISGNGDIRIRPKPNNVTAVFGLAYDIIEPEVNEKSNWASCPNVFRATSGDNSVTVKDFTSDTPLSINSRGREVWAEDSNCHLSDGETLEQYARRRLAEEQTIITSVHYSRRYDPDINVGDIIELHYPEQGLTGVYAVVSQSIRLGYGVEVTEEVQR